MVRPSSFALPQLAGKHRAVFALFSKIIAAMIALSCLNAAHATTAVLQPPREAAARLPLELVLLYSDDDTQALSIDVPQSLEVTLTNGDAPPQPLILQREPNVPDKLTLRPGQYRKVRFSAPWPDSARGIVKIDPVGFDSSPMLVTLNRGDTQTQVVAAEHAETQARTPSATRRRHRRCRHVSRTDTARRPHAERSPVDLRAHVFRRWPERRQPRQVQFSFKYRIMLPDDPRSRAFLDNLYFAYTQTSIWDLSADSAPFRDTSYEPQLFYYLQDTGWTSPFFTAHGRDHGYRA